MTAHTAPAAIATVLDVPNPAALDDMEPHLAWGALHGIARGQANRWAVTAEALAQAENPAAARAAGDVARAMDALAGACEDQGVDALKALLGITD